MRKVLFVSGAVVILLIIGTVIVHLCCSASGDRGCVIRLWAEILGAIGSFGAVIIALYKEPIWAIINAPRLEMNVGNDGPFCSIENTMSGGGDEIGKFIEICGKITNCGMSAANKCQVTCEEIYTLGADGKYSASDKHQFRPMSFKWSDTDSKELDIPNELHGYIKLAEIRARGSELGGETGEKSNGKRNSKLYIVVAIPDKTVMFGMSAGASDVVWWRNIIESIAIKSDQQFCFCLYQPIELCDNERKNSIRLKDFGAKVFLRSMWNDMDSVDRQSFLHHIDQFHVLNVHEDPLGLKAFGKKLVCRDDSRNEMTTASQSDLRSILCLL